MKRYSIYLALAMCILLGQGAIAADKAPDAQRDFTFLSMSDCHYAALKNEDRNTRNLDTIRAINALTDISWPDELGDGRVQAPKGVMALGDLIDDGDMKTGDVNVSEKQYATFVEQCGLDGKDGVLKYPIFETWGNHDGPPVGSEKNGFSSQAHLIERNKIRKEKGLISNISDSGLHYSWDWADVHFVSLGIYPADKQRDGIHYSPVWHNPQGALSFLKADLEKNVGKSGRPVVLMAHMGMDTDWWVKDDYADLYKAVKDYNIVLYIFGHSGTGVREWAPEGEAKKWLLVNEGQLENGFFVFNFKGDTLRIGQRIKNWTEKKAAIPEGKPTRFWNGEWQWKWTQKVKLAKVRSVRN